MATDETADIVVVGGGMVGLASAIALKDRGLNVVLCDPGEARARTSYGNAGVVSRGSILPMSSPALWGKLPAYLRNADRGLRLRYAHLPRILPYTAHFLASARASAWRRAAAALLPLTSAAYPAHERLAARAGTSERLQRTGWIKAYRTEAAFEAAALEREILSGHGVAFDILDTAGIRDLEPALVRPYARAMLLTETGSVREPGRLIELQELRLDAEPLEDEARGEVGAGARDLDVDLLARELADVGDVLRGDDVHLVVREAGDVGDLILDPRDLALAADRLDRVGADEGEVDAAQVDEVAHILRRALADHRQDAELIAVVEHRHDVGGELQEGAGGAP